MSIEGILGSCNQRAMEFLCKERYEECHRLLRKAVIVIKSMKGFKENRLYAITWNNFGCYYKRVKEYDLALKCLMRAMKIGGLENVFLAEIHLNILAVLRTQKKLGEALVHGIKAIILLRGTKEYVTIICALKSTAGVYLALGKIEKALKMFVTSHGIAEKILGKDHGLTLDIEEKIKSLKAIEKKFYFEKVKIIENTRFFNNFHRNENKTFTPIPASKSLQKGTKMRKILKIQKKNPLSPVIVVNNKRRLLLNKSKSKSPNNFAILEEKVKTLTNQLESFQARYSELEQFTKANSPKNPSKSKTPEIKPFTPKQVTKDKLKQTLQEFEVLKRLAETEEMFLHNNDSKLSQLDTEKNTFYKTIDYSAHNLLQKPNKL